MLKIQKNISCSKRKNILHDDTDLGVFGRCLWLHSQSLEWWPNLAANGSLSTSQSFIKARIILWQNRKHDNQWITEACASRSSSQCHGRVALREPENRKSRHPCCRLCLGRQGCRSDAAAEEQQLCHLGVSGPITEHLFVTQPDQLHFLKTELVK